jgi:hypothetical protein
MKVVLVVGPIGAGAYERRLEREGGLLAQAVGRLRKQFCRRGVRRRLVLAAGTAGERDRGQRGRREQPHPVERSLSGRTSAVS